MNTPTKPQLGRWDIRAQTIQHNKPPTYEATPYVVPETGCAMPGWFAVYEIRDGARSFCFKMSNRGDRLNEILKRGVPMDEARKLFYQMDGNTKGGAQ